MQQRKTVGPAGCAYEKYRARYFDVTETRCGRITREKDNNLPDSESGYTSVMRPRLCWGLISQWQRVPVFKALIRSSIISHSRVRTRYICSLVACLRRHWRRRAEKKRDYVTAAVSGPFEGVILVAASTGVLCILGHRMDLAGSWSRTWRFC